MKRTSKGGTRRALRGLVAVCVGAVALTLAACDKADYTGVTFKPTEAAAGAYRTSVVLAVTRRTPTRGTGTVSEHGRVRGGLIGREWTMASSGAVVVDGATVAMVDERGLVTIDGMTVGVHDVALAMVVPESADERRSRRRSRDLVRVRTNVHVPVTVVRDRQTVVLLDYRGPDDVRVYQQAGDHDFIMERVFRALARKAADIDGTLDAFAAVMAGTAPEDTWSGLFVDDARDERGRVRDWLQAHRYLVGVGECSGARTAFSCVTFDERRTEALVKTVYPSKPPTYHRLVLRRSLGDDDVWKIASVSVDPKS